MKKAGEVDLPSRRTLNGLRDGGGKTRARRESLWGGGGHRGFFGRVGLQAANLNRR